MFVSTSSHEIWSNGFIYRIGVMCLSGTAELVTIQPFFSFEISCNKHCAVLIVAKPNLFITSFIVIRLLNQT